MSHGSYNDSDLSTDLNKVRLIIQDTSSTDFKFSDEEITFFISEEANIYGAAASAKESLASKTAEKVSKTVGKLKIELQQQFEHHIEQAKNFRTQSQTKGSSQIFAGGLSVTGKDAQRADTDRVDPKFTRDMDQFPGTGEGGST